MPACPRRANASSKATVPRCKLWRTRKISSASSCSVRAWLTPLALEAALKFQEMAIVTSEAYHSLEYRHGPKSTADRDTLVILLDPEGHSDYGVDLLRDLRSYGVSSLAIGETAQTYRGVADEVVALESGLSEAERWVLTLLPIHLLAFETALRLGQNPDKPRNLSPVVKF